MPAYNPGLADETSARERGKERERERDPIYVSVSRKPEGAFSDQRIAIPTSQLAKKKKLF
jgi:hypothetical protein